MKTIRTVFAVFVFSLVMFPLMAQDEDPMTCLKNYSLYKEYYNQKNYDDALPFWRLVYNGSCATVLKQEPQYAKIPKIIYQNGATMFKRRIVDALKAGDQEKANAYVDTLMAIYDKRIEIYPEDEGKVRGFKGIELLKYRKGDPEATKQAYTCLSKAVELSKERIQPTSLAAYMDATISLYHDNIITNEEVVDNYSRTMDILNAKLNEKPDNEEVSKLKDAISANFANSGAATCESLVALFSPQFEKNKENPEELKKYIYWLKETGCEDQDLYLESLVALQKIKPDAASAYTISQIYKRRGRYTMATNYLQEAADLEEDGQAKARYYIDMADITFRIEKDLPKAKSYVLKAIEADPSSGLPHILLGNIYGNAKDYGDDELAHQAVFWAAVDQFEIAKQKDPSLAEVADERIASFSKHFPSQETVFFYGYKVGDTYELGGWINVRTKVRIR